MTKPYSIPTPGIDERVEIRCHRCKALLSRVVTRMPPPARSGITDNEPLLPSGRFVLSEELLKSSGEFFGAEPAEVLIGVEDLPNAKPGGIRQGCCGPDGQDGPNLFCARGHKVGTEMGDCWMPHFVRLPLKWIEMCSPDLGVQD